MKIELHLHTAEISFCGKIPANDVLLMYRQAGYDAVVITNHFNSYTAEEWSRRGITDFWKYYHDSFDAAAVFGETIGFKVFCGYEVRFNESANDYLVFGMTRDFCRDYEMIFRMTPSEFGVKAKENGFLFYQAHPFRNGMTVTNPADLFGIEVKNTHPRHDSRNDIAVQWAEKFHLHKIGGSDCHQVQDAAHSGILTNETVQTMEELVEVLRNDRYTIL